MLNLAINARAFNATGPLNTNQYTNQVFANVTHNAGKQTLFFGGNIDIYNVGRNQGTTNSGAYTFISNSRAFFATTTQFEQAFAQFLLGQVSSFQQTSVDVTNGNHSSLYEAYFQDDYRLSPRLTINTGLRYFLKVEPRLGTFNGSAPIAFSNFDTGTYRTATAAAISGTGLICTASSCSGGGTPNVNHDPLNGIIIAGQNSPFGNTILDQPLLNLAPRVG